MIDELAYKHLKYLNNILLAETFLKYFFLLHKDLNLLLELRKCQSHWINLGKNHDKIFDDKLLKGSKIWQKLVFNV